MLHIVLPVVSNAGADKEQEGRGVIFNYVFPLKGTTYIHAGNNYYYGSYVSGKVRKQRGASFVDVAMLPEKIGHTSGTRTQPKNRLLRFAHFQRP